MAEINIKSFILPQDALGQQNQNQAVVTAKPRKKNAPEYRTLFVSGPDFAIEKKTPKAVVLMVCMTSQGQFYIKKESSGGVIEPLGKENFTEFMTGSEDDEIRIEDENGVSPFWIKILRKDHRWRAAFLNIVKAEYIRPYLTADMTSMERLCTGRWNESLGDEVLHTSTAAFMRAVSFKDAKKCFDILVQHMDREEVKKMLSAEGPLGKFLLEEKRYNYRGGEDVIPSAYESLYEEWGIGGVRKFLEQYCASGVHDLPDARTMKSIMNREWNARKDVTRGRHNMQNEKTAFDLSSFTDYFFGACVEQGYANDCRGFWQSWADYMDQQMTLYGEIRDKYSEHLASDHQIMSFRIEEIKKATDEEGFARAARKMAKYEAKIDGFKIVAPKVNDDLIEEGRRMSHCVGSYGDRIISGSSYIFFMRDGADDGKSVATIEIALPSFNVQQFRARFNKQPSADCEIAMEKWLKKAQGKYFSEQQDEDDEKIA